MNTTPTGSVQVGIAIAGAGAAGLSLAWQLHNSTSNDQTVAIVDSSFQPKADKTWCFWDKEANVNPAFLKAQWKEVRVIGPSAEIRQQLKTHTYFCVDSARFQTLVMRDISTNPLFSCYETPVLHIHDRKDYAQIITPQQRIDAGIAFQSVHLPPEQAFYNSDRVGLRQHFLGWEIESTDAVFDPTCVTLHDFRVSQEHGFAFMYVLPFSAHAALVEITYFTPALLPREVYIAALEQYLSHHFGIHLPKSGQSGNAVVVREEYGVIPMVDGYVASAMSPHVVPIGTAAGLTKGSTGYTYGRIQHDSRYIVSCLQNGKPIRRKPLSPWRYRLYDLLILHLIREEPQRATGIFMQLFARNGFDTMFDFLDEKLNFAQELRIMASVPKYSDFLKAIVRTRHRLTQLGPSR